MVELLSFLRPNKANIVGTIALLAANWLGGVISRYAVLPLIFDAMGGTMQNGGRGGGFGAGGMAQFGSFGLAAGAANLIILAVLFYIIISFTLAEIAKSPESQKTKS